MPDVTIPREMTIQEALTTLEQCGQEYSQRADAFRRLSAAALLAFQVQEGMEQAERERQVVLQDLARVKEEYQRLNVQVEGMKRSIVEQRTDGDRALAALKAQQTKQQSELQQEYNAWRNQLGTDRAMLLHAHEEEVKLLDQEKAEHQAQLDAVKGELAEMRRRFLQVTRAEA